MIITINDYVLILYWAYWVAVLCKRAENQKSGFVRLPKRRRRFSGAVMALGRRQ